MIRGSLHNLAFLGWALLSAACAGGLQGGAPSGGAPGGGASLVGTVGSSGGPTDSGSNNNSEAAPDNILAASHNNLAAPMQGNGAVSPDYDPTGGNSLTKAVNVSSLQPLPYGLHLTEDTVKSELGPGGTKLNYNYLEGTLQKTEPNAVDIRLIRVVDWQTRTFIVSSLVANSTQKDAYDFSASFGGLPVPVADLVHNFNPKVSFFITSAVSTKDALDQRHPCSTHDCLNDDEDWHVAIPE